MNIKTTLTKDIIIFGHGTSESGEPFVRLEIKGKRVLVRVNNLLLSPKVEFARLQTNWPGLDPQRGES